MGRITFYITVFLLASCGGNLDSASTEFFECGLSDHEINMENGEACIISESIIETYAVEPARISSGLVVCDDGYFEINGLTFPSGTIFGQTYHGVTVNCEPASDD